MGKGFADLLARKVKDWLSGKTRPSEGKGKGKGKALYLRERPKASGFRSLAKALARLVKHHRNIGDKKNKMNNSMDDICLTTGKCHHSGQDCGH